MSLSGCVLVVDDQEDIRESLREVIELAGCESICAANGVEALRLLERHRPCLIVLDLLMPVMNGSEVLDELQKHPELAQLPVVISTSAPDLAPEGVPVLPKPIDIARLWTFLRGNCQCAAATPPRSVPKPGAASD
ncbi:MAG TPA: response regulator [Polyangiales bacterium]|nr:response regulator [Polyangiales bacterium]